MLSAHGQHTALVPRALLLRCLLQSASDACHLLSCDSCLRHLTIANFSIHPTRHPSVHPSMHARRWCDWR